NNGSVDLRTGGLRAHQRTDLITKLAPVAYDPKADAPIFKAFLRQIFFQNESLIGFVKRAFGYALTGSVEEQVLFFFHGSGQNGKTTLVNAILNTLGPDYAQTAAPGLLMVKRNEPHPTEIADLWGKRVIVTVEVEQGKRLAEVLVKQLTGSERLKGRFMRKDFFEFSPMHKIFLVANHKPVIKGTDFAIWRRIKLVPFNIVIPEAERDTTLPEKLKGEVAGILAWCVQGCLEWQRNGLGTPEEVKVATAEYKSEMDTLGDFLAERCEVDPEAEVVKADLYGAYIEWAEKGGEHPLSKKEFGMRLKERRIEDNRSGKERTRVWRGLKLV
ncbi:MAG: phage/plasmid primase, P4 family, partial [bacterium]|nr:phage/plasmid primase, P4 family [bacterium]